MILAPICLKGTEGRGPRCAWNGGSLTFSTRVGWRLEMGWEGWPRPRLVCAHPVGTGRSLPTSDFVLTVFLLRVVRDVGRLCREGTELAAGVWAQPASHLGCDPKPVAPELRVSQLTEGLIF